MKWGSLILAAAMTSALFAVVVLVERMTLLERRIDNLEAAGLPSAVSHAARVKCVSTQAGPEPGWCVTAMPGPAPAPASWITPCPEGSAAPGTSCWTSRLRTEDADPPRE